MDEAVVATDVMTTGIYPDDPLPAPRGEGGGVTCVPEHVTVIAPLMRGSGRPFGPCGCPECTREDIRELLTRVRDLELVCQAQQKALNFVIVRWMKAQDQRDLKEHIWPDLEAAEMILHGD
jgi:hypothetical protein